METTYKPTYEQLEEVLEIAQRKLGCINRLREASNFAYCVQKVSSEALQEITSAITPPPPTYKEVTVERWECQACGCITKIQPRQCLEPISDDENCSSVLFTKLTGTRRVPVKQPVRKRVIVDARINSGFLAGHPSTCPDTGNPLFHDYPECHGKKVTLAAEWTEE